MFWCQVLREIDNITEIETVYNVNISSETRSGGMMRLVLHSLSLSSGRGLICSWCSTICTWLWLVDYNIYTDLSLVDEYEYSSCSLIGWWNIILIFDWLTGTRLWWHQSHLLEWWTWAEWCRVFASPDPATDNTLWPPSPLSSSLSSSWVSSSVSTDRWAENQSSCAEWIDNVELRKKIEKLKITQQE